MCLSTVLLEHDFLREFGHSFLSVFYWFNCRLYIVYLYIVYFAQTAAKTETQYTKHKK